MIENQKPRPTMIIGPLGEPLTLATLPPPDTRRWVPRRKAEVVAAVNGGLLTTQEACSRYGLSLEEFVSWQRAVDRVGLAGLRITRTQHYRDVYDRQRRNDVASGYSEQRDAGNKLSSEDSKSGE